MDEKEQSVINNKSSIFFTDGEAPGTYSISNQFAENLEFRNYTDEGLLVALSSDVTIRNNVIQHNGSNSIEPDYNGEGFGLNITDASNILIENNRVVQNGPGAERRARSIMGTGINTYAAKQMIIRGNLSSNNVGGGILVEDGVQVVVENNMIEKNDLDVSADGWWDAGIWVDGGHDVTIRNNTIRNNLGPGIEVTDADLQYYKYPDATRGYVVTNNIISGNYWALYTYNFGQCPLPPKEILVWENNSIEKNRYTGSLPDEFEYDREKQLLCDKWPCGEMKACTADHEKPLILKK